MSFRFKRTFWQALLISLLIHTVILVGVVSLDPEPGEVPAVIRVDIGRGRLEASANNPGAPLVRPEVVAIPLRVPATGSSPRPPMPAPLPDASAAIRSESVGAKINGSGERASGVETSVPGSPGKGGAESASVAGENVSADEMRQYRIDLATAMRRFKRYPALARDRGWEGTTGVALSVSSRLVAPEVVLAQSSGRSVLDDQAVEMVTQAARVTRLPESLKGRSFRVLLPVKFSLEGDQ
ncbi:MAG: TonB family protein [Betaproteobacteria bacterium]